MTFDDIYNEFKQDFLNKNFTRTDMLKKYNLSPNKYNQLRIKVCKECNLSHKPFTRGESRIITDDTYIYPAGRKFRVSKTINHKTVNFGLYDTFEIAKVIRDKLISCNWDKSKLNEIQEEVYEYLEK